MFLWCRGTSTWNCLMCFLVFIRFKLDFNDKCFKLDFNGKTFKLDFNDKYH